MSLIPKELYVDPLIEVKDVTIEMEFESDISLDLLNKYNNIKCLFNKYWNQTLTYDDYDALMKYLKRSYKLRCLFSLFYDTMIFYLDWLIVFLLVKVFYKIGNEIIDEMEGDKDE